MNGHGLKIEVTLYAFSITLSCFFRVCLGLKKNSVGGKYSGSQLGLLNWCQKVTYTQFLFKELFFSELLCENWYFWMQISWLLAVG